MAEQTPEVDIDSVIDRLLEGEAQVDASKQCAGIDETMDYASIKSNTLHRALSPYCCRSKKACSVLLQLL